MARDGIVLGIHPVVVAVIAGLRELGDVELRLGIEVPFSNVAGFVADPFEQLGVGDLTVAEMSRVISGKVSPDAISVRSTTGENGGAGRGAHTAGRVALGELDALRGELVEVGCFDERVTVGRGVSPAHVIGDEDDEVGLGDFCRC